MIDVDTQQQGGMAARAEELQAAALTMIQPLLAPTDPDRIGAELADAIENCARMAARHELRGVGYLSAIVAPFLRKGGVQIDQPASREILETWLNDLLAFCVGQLPLRQTRVLVDQLLLWPKLAQLPTEFAELIVDRLERDSKLLATIHRGTPAAESGAGGGEVAAADFANLGEGSGNGGYSGNGELSSDGELSGNGVISSDGESSSNGDTSGNNAASGNSAVSGNSAASGDVESSGEVQSSPDRPAEWLKSVAGEVSASAAMPGANVAHSVDGQLASLADAAAGARSVHAGQGREYAGDNGEADANRIDIGDDELELLAEEAGALEARLLPALLVSQSGIGLAETLVPLLEEAVDSLAAMGNALGVMGLGELKISFQSLASRLQSEPMLAVGQAEQLHRLLIELPATLRAGFESLEPEKIEALRQVVAPWLSEREAAAFEVLGRLRRVASRPALEAARWRDAGDWSVAVPDDADAAVVAQLRRELPRLCEGFADAVARLQAGDREGLADTQRIVHTIKGAASTVGVASVAALTHLLEDLLQLVLEARVGLDEPVLDLLERGSDLLFEVQETLAGEATAPLGLPALHADLVALVDGIRGASHRLAEQPEQGAASADGPQPPIATDSSQQTAVASFDLPGSQPHSSGLTRPLGESSLPVAESAAATSDATAVMTASALADAHSSPAMMESSSTEADSSLADAESSLAMTASPMADSGQPQTPQTPAEPSEEVLQVPATLIEQMLDAIHQASIKLAQLQSRIGIIDATRLSLRGSNEGLEDLAGELERMVDVRGVALSARSGQSDFDPLELDEYSDLQTLSRRIAEVGADQRVIDRQLDEPLIEIKELGDQIERLQFDLQDLMHGTRRMRLRSVSARLRRAVRQAARMAGKQVALEIDGEDTEIDGGVLQKVVDCLTHLLRNAVDHGIEDEARRQSLGKPAMGRVRLRFARQAAAIRIECEDDGAGIDVDRVYARARSLKLLPESATRAELELPGRLAELLVMPGFTTREQVSELSGRGVGLDVVFQILRGLRGTFALNTVPGQGTRFVIEIPVQAVSQPVLVVNDERFCLALVARDVEEILAAGSLAIDTAGRKVALSAHGMVAVRSLSELLGMPEQAFAATPAQSMVLVVRDAAGGRSAIVTPPLDQARKVMVRALPDWVAVGAGVIGLTVLGEGSVASVVDPRGLLAAPPEESVGYSREIEVREVPQPVCLVVDDSVSVRRSMELFLSDIGLKPVGASDGLQALDRARREKPAIVIVDFEMPRMNGIEFAKAFRADAQFAGIPIIMITSRATPKHRKRALDAGIDVFMTKPYTEDSVASEIQRCLLRKLG